ncbi:MAG TPA: polyamine ABC transporter substrate-binding protein [Steroidobacteraceae bacterium]|jgi:putrescine transport system substrate-binding protein|nr:polyamine ABC transporter substrate-binding protein [Steroidobacteraceae bacterium]
MTNRALLALLTAGTLCACSPDPRTSEKVVNIYNWSDYIGKDTLAQFERKTGIKVVYDTYDADETLEARMMAGDSGYDVVSTSTDYFSRQIKAGIYQELDRSKLPGWKNLDPEVLAQQAAGDPGNRHAMPYLRHVNGFAYNVELVRARMPDAPVDSLDMLFKPDIVAKFADCGVTFLDSAEDVLQLALNYLHINPNTTAPADYKRAEQLILSVRPYVRTFDSTEYMNGLADREFCVSMSWSGDYATIKARARSAGIDVPLTFTIPKEGANGSTDALLIPKDAPHAQAAYEFLNFILEPQVIAQITNDIHYANANLAANPYIDPRILSDPVVYTTPEIRSRLYRSAEVSPSLERLRTRTWTRIKTAR